MSMEINFLLIKWLHYWRGTCNCYIARRHGRCCVKPLT